METRYNRPQRETTRATTTTPYYHSLLTQTMDLNRLRTYYALEDCESGLRNDINKGYQKNKRRLHPSMDAFEQSLVHAGHTNNTPTSKKKRVRPVCNHNNTNIIGHVPSNNKNTDDDFMYYDKDGQYINRDLEESQLF